MDTFNFNFDTDSTLTNDTNSNLDWTAFQSESSPSSSTSSSSIITNNPFSPNWLPQQDDAVAPDDETYFEVERFFNDLNQQQQQDLELQQDHGNIEPIHVNSQINHLESPHRIHVSSIINEQPPTTCLSTPSSVPHHSSSSSRSQCYHKLPDRAVKLMQEWYNANLDDPYPRSPDKKRFITEGNITAQQCRSWFANRRQRLKHVKRCQPRTLSSSSSSSSCQSIETKLTQTSSIEEPAKIPDQCYYCQQTTATLNVVINQQTVEQLIHNSLRKLFYPSIM